MLEFICHFYSRNPNDAYQDSLSDNSKLDFIRRRWVTFIAITVGYSAYYVCRYSWNVVKKPLADDGVFDAAQMGWIGSALFFSYAFGKLTNGILADHANIRRFMATGLLVSAVANLILGYTTAFWLFALLWGVNGWFQSFGAPSSVVTLSHWFGDKQRGTYYGIWSCSHNIGGYATYVGTAFVVGAMGWQWGFRIAGLVGLLVAILLWRLVSERPQVYGLPSPVEADKAEVGSVEEKSVKAVQLQVFKNPAIWILAAASACMYVSRYAIDSWGIFFLQAEKGYSLEAASGILGLKEAFGILGTITSGFVSDKFFKGRRNMPALLFGLLYTAAISLFVWGPSNIYIDSLSMILFGLALGVLLCFLGGLMAVDICPKDAAGTALGIVGVASYLGAAAQDILSGYFIENGKQVINSETVYDFHTASIMWIGASVLSLILATFVWNAQSSE